jgi:hypothetical protein
MVARIDEVDGEPAPAAQLRLVGERVQRLRDAPAAVLGADEGLVRIAERPFQPQPDPARILGIGVREPVVADEPSGLQGADAGPAIAEGIAHPGGVEL